MFDPIKAPTIYPISMSRFGLIDAIYGGGPKYRLLWSPSRMVTVTGPDNTVTVPMYADGTVSPDNPTGALGLYPIGACWILEKHQTPQELGGVSITAARWNADPQLLLLGPFPAKGDYYPTDPPLACHPSDANIEKLITWLEAGRKRNPNENAQACVSNLEKSLAEKKSTRDAMFRDAMRPWNGADPYVSGVGKGRGSKTFKQLKSANELGLTKHGPDLMKGRFKKVMYEIPVEV